MPHRLFSPTLSSNVVTVTFSATYGTAPRMIMITPASANTAQAWNTVQPFVDQASNTPTTFSITTSSATTFNATTTYKFYYAVIG